MGVCVSGAQGSEQVLLLASPPCLRCWATLRTTLCGYTTITCWCCRPCCASASTVYGEQPSTCSSSSNSSAAAAAAALWHCGSLHLPGHTGGSV